MIISSEKILAAASRIRDVIRETPVDYSTQLSSESGSRVYLKLEHIQHTGSFKLRGAANKILSLDRSDLDRGVMAASTGNHGLGVCYAARQAGAQATIYLPSNTSESKIRMMRDLGGNIVLCDGDCLTAELTARAAAEEAGCTFISPYNDLDVIAGQGTIGLELTRQMTQIDAAFISVGGGGLIAGVATWLKYINPAIRIVGCWPENSRVMYESLRAGEIIEFPEEPTISESTAGGVEPGSVTFPLCRDLIDDFALVSEAEIFEAMRLVASKERWIVEGSAGVAVAGLIKTSHLYRDLNVVVLLCGRNIPFEKLPW